MSHYIQLYAGNGQQSGGSLSDIVLYEGPTHHHHHHSQQLGAGLGNYFDRAFRLLRPLFSSGINALKHQGIKSSKAVLSQLGKKDLKTILKDEGKRALSDLQQKAINKLSQSSGKISSENQFGTGLDAFSINKMPVGFSPAQLLRFSRHKGIPEHLLNFYKNKMGDTIVNKKLSKRRTRKKSTIKGSSSRKRVQTVRRRRVGGSGVKTKIRKRQVGGGKKKKRAARSRKTNEKNYSKRQVDIFN